MTRHPARTTVAEAGPEESPVIWRLLQLYLYEMSDIFGIAIGEDGEYPYPYFSLYWEEPGRFPMLISSDGHLAGFALTREVAPGTYEIAEFFILKRSRRAGVARTAARLILDRRPGDWQIRYHPTNTPATALWQSLAAERPNTTQTTTGPQTLLHLPW